MRGEDEVQRGTVESKEEEEKREWEPERHSCACAHMWTHLRDSTTLFSS